MSNYIDWKPAKSVALDKLVLDLENPRLSDLGKNPNQGDIIKYLLEHEDVLTLIKRIVYFGYLPNESPIVIKNEKGQYIVLEGNRRVAACKLLLNPSLAPAKKRKTIENLADEMGRKLEKLHVIPVDLKEHADILIENRHTTSQIKSWDPTKQDRFYYRELIKGSTIQDIARKYHRTQSTIKSFIKRYHVYKEATSLNLEESLWKQVADETKFDVTNLERFYSFEKGRKFLGLSFNPDGSLNKTLEEAEFTKRFTKALQDIVSKTFNSRIANNEGNFNKYFEKYIVSAGFEDPDGPEESEGKEEKSDNPAENETPNESNPAANEPNNPDSTPSVEATSTEGNNGSTQNMDEETEPSPTTGQPEQQNGNDDEGKKRRTNTLIQNEEFYCQTRIPRLDKIFTELKRLNFNDHSNAIAILFRSFLEMTVLNFIDLNGHYQLLLTEKGKEITKDNEKKLADIKALLLENGLTEETLALINTSLKKSAKLSGGVGKDWAPTLMAMLKYLTRPDITLISNQSMKEGLKHYLQPSREKLSHYDFNSFVHNSFVLPIKEELTEIWNTLSPLIKFMLREIKAKNQQ